MLLTWWEECPLRSVRQEYSSRRLLRCRVHRHRAQSLARSERRGNGEGIDSTRRRQSQQRLDEFQHFQPAKRQPQRPLFTQGVRGKHCQGRGMRGGGADANLFEDNALPKRGPRLPEQSTVMVVPPHYLSPSLPALQRHRQSNCDLHLQRDSARKFCRPPSSPKATVSVALEWQQVATGGAQAAHPSKHSAAPFPHRENLATDQASRVRSAASFARCR